MRKLAPSARVAAYLGRRARPVLALTTTTVRAEAPSGLPFYDKKAMYPPDPVDLPETILTPAGDLWPRPYYLENGLRRVAPYHYTYNTFCKQRWRGRTILDIFSSEFRDRDREYYRNAIETGQIAINGKPCADTTTVVKNGDVVSHTLHRHEPPVTAQPIRTVHEDEDMIVIDKPAGVPVHPAGRYKFNCVIEIMRAERSYSFNPLPVNRLDRLTSGVMFVARNGPAAEKLSNKLRGRSVRKEYVARVKGRFPDGKGGMDDQAGIVKCDQSILQISPILGLNRARASGKSATTLFRRVAYYPPETQTVSSTTTSTNSIVAAATPAPVAKNAGYSIVHCLPLTGRTHQIRVHLQFLGHPISNDPIYSNRRVFGSNLAKSNNLGDDDKDVIAKLSKMGKEELAEAYSYTSNDTSSNGGVSSLVSETQQITLSDVNAIDGSSRKPLPQTLHAGSLDSRPAEPNGYDMAYGEMVKAHDEMVTDYNRRKGEKITGEKCQVCDTPLYSDPGPQELGIYLHALAYADMEGSWSYRSPMPAWALPPAGQDGPREIGEWQNSGVGWEKLDIGDEKEEGERRNRGGMHKNKNQGPDSDLEAVSPHPDGGGRVMRLSVGSKQATQQDDE